MDGTRREHIKHALHALLKGFTWKQISRGLEMRFGIQQEDYILELIRDADEGLGKSMHSERVPISPETVRCAQAYEKALNDVLNAQIALAKLGIYQPWVPTPEDERHIGGLKMRLEIKG